ncbi:MAG: hypothetical protein NTV62_03825 [Candidatus Gribaldobacteria bacterium]|nr:hypothetical protein [Candidatus Gribaldobacteria bacterium]
MQLEEFKKIVMQQAQKKGFGVKPEDIIVAEKIALIHAEISEAYEAYLNSNLEGVHGLYEELGDILQRVLHLGGIFNLDFSTELELGLKVASDLSFDVQISQVHLLVSKTYEAYRQKKEQEFDSSLINLAYVILRLADNFDFSLAEVIAKKIETNQKREWNSNKLNEHLRG